MADGTGQKPIPSGLQALLQGLQSYPQKFSNYWFGSQPAQAIPAPTATQQPQQQQRQLPQMAGLPPARVTASFPPGGGGAMTPQQIYKQMYEQTPEQFITAHRFNEKKPEEGPIESLPHYFKIDRMQPLLNAVKTARTQLGLKNMPTPEDFTAMALAEGRSDFGFNGKYDDSKEYLRNIHDKLVAAGHSPYAASFVATIVEKQKRAEKKGVPFAHAWNGMRKTKEGRTGAQHAERVEKNRTVVPHQKNQPLYQFIKQNAALDMPQEDAAMAAKGGHIGKPLPGGNKMI